MKKKIFSLLLALCLFLPIFAITGCNSGSPGWQIREGEWKNTISTEEFYMAAMEPDMVANDQPMGISYKYYKNDGEYKNVVDYTVIFKDSSLEDGRYKLRFLKQMDEQGNAVGYYLVDINAGTYASPSNLTEITETEFNRHIGTYISLVDYISNNYSKFSTTQDTPENLLLPTSYTCDVTDMNNDQSIASLNIAQLFITKEDVINGYFITSTNAYWQIHFTPAIERVYDKLTTYYIKGGPSTTDVDYGEYYYDGDNGFRMYTPNNPVANRQDAYYKKNADETYSKYVKLSNGTWSVSQTNANDFNTMISTTKELYLAFMTEFYNFKVTEDNGLSCTYQLNTDNSFSKVTGSYTYKYYDIIVVVSNDNISSITWKMQFTLGQASSLVYHMELGLMTEGLTYPSV